MTPFHEAFLPFFLMGCSVAAIAAFFAGRARGCVLPACLIFVGVIAFWGAIFAGSDIGYRAWQAMDDPPDEAFSDASVMGAMVLGWFPGLLYCLTIFGVVRALNLALRWANPDKYERNPTPSQKREHTENPYQAPNAG